MGKEKKRKLEDSGCLVCPSKVGLDPIGFVRVRGGRVACLSHPGVEDETFVNRELIFLRNTGDPRDGKFRVYDTAASEKVARRELKLAREKAADLAPKAAVSCKPTPQLDCVKRGKGGRGDGGFREDREDRENGSSHRRPRDPRENLFILDDEPLRTDNSTQPRKKKGRRQRTA